jgi:hypothetical protein
MRRDKIAHWSDFWRTAALRQWAIARCGLPNESPDVIQRQKLSSMLETDLPALPPLRIPATPGFQGPRGALSPVADSLGLWL